jgi:hypothetical protein
MSDHEDLRKFLAGQSPAWLADRLVGAAGRDRALLAELQSAASGRDALQTARQEVDRAIFVSGFVDEEEVGTYVAGIDRALEMLTGLIDSGHAAQAAGLAEHALQLMHESAESVNYEYELAECAGFAQELHRRACLAADVDRRALAAWLFDAVSRDDYGLFHSAVADYAQVLGEPGMERLRELIDTAMATGVRYPLLQMAEQAVRPLGVDAVVDVLAKDLRGARQYTRICQELISAGRDEQALEWARRGLKERGSERDHGLSELRVITVSLCGRLDKPTEAVELAWEEFAANPSLEAYKRLCEHAVTEGTWPSWRDRALAALRAQPRIGESSPVPDSYRPPGHSTLIHVLLWEGDEEAAWRAAQQGGCADGLWLELARRRTSTHPADAATVLRQQIEAAVALTKRDGYDRALSLLAELRACHERMDTLDQFDDYVTRLRNANSRKHSFTARLKNACQPR